MKRDKHVFQMNTRELHHELEKRNINCIEDSRTELEGCLSSFLENDHFCVEQQKHDNKLLAAGYAAKQSGSRIAKDVSDLIGSWTGTWLLTRSGIDCKLLINVFFSLDEKVFSTSMILLIFLICLQTFRPFPFPLLLRLARLTLALHSP